LFFVDRYQMIEFWTQIKFLLRLLDVCNNKCTIIFIYTVL